MIVVDTNLVSYLLFSSPMTEQAEGAFRRGPDWVAPPLWRSEFRNVLLGFARRNELNATETLVYWDEAQTLVATLDTDQDGAEILKLALESGCTAYDCEFVALASRRGIPLVTADKALLKAFPGIATGIKEFTQVESRD